MREPSTQWKEQVAADEEQRFKGYAELIRSIQQQGNAHYGKPERAVHRKTVLALEGELEVLDGLPAHAKQGLFARPGKYRALLRLSNGSHLKQKDSVGDVRGFAFKALGVEGPGALGGTTRSQDFALIHQEAFAFESADQFVRFVGAAIKGPLAIVGHMVKAYGLFGGLGRLKKLAGSLSGFTGFTTSPFFSAVPIACGPYAVKVRLSPPRSNAVPDAKADYAAEVKKQLESGPLTWELQLQFFVDDQLTPIERPHVPWPTSESPYLTVARLTVKPGGASEAITAEVEKEKFDPWNALVEHRPLGDVMRARKVAYYASQQGRGVA